MYSEFYGGKIDKSRRLPNSERLVKIYYSLRASGMRYREAISTVADESREPFSRVRSMVEADRRRKRKAATSNAATFPVDTS